MDLKKLEAKMQEYAAAGVQAAARKGQSGTVFIYSDIGPTELGAMSAKAFADEVAALGQVEQLNIRINSVGGSIVEALAIYNTILQHPAKSKVVHIDGLAASAASFVAMAGTRIIMAASATMMVHEAWAGAAGTAADHRRMADMLDRNNGILASIYAKRTKQSEDAIRALLSAETWLTAAEAVAQGFADEVAKDEVQAKADPVSLPKALVEVAVTQRDLNEADRILAEMELTLHTFA